jgi:hypothetical protein
VAVAGPQRYSRKNIDRSSFPTRRCCLQPSTSVGCRPRPLAENDAVVAVDNDFPRHIDNILQLLPETGRCSWCWALG